VPEPYANAIGILTKGTNVLHRSRVRIGEMFGKGPFVTALKDGTHHPMYRALAIDVGAFTTDFAALTLKPDGNNTADPDEYISIVQSSLPIGVSDLDSRLIESLPREKGEWLRKASPMEWEDFRPAVYTEGKGIRVPDLGVVGGPTDAEIVRGCLAEFSRQLSIEAEKFRRSLGAIPQGSLQELLLTGGGSYVPAIRESLMAAAQSPECPFVKTHAPAIKRVSGGPQIDKLDASFVRGGSALGGASTYFEKSLY
jgi:hypothetical protein